MEALCFFSPRYHGDSRYRTSAVDGFIHSQRAPFPPRKNFLDLTELIPISWSGTEDLNRILNQFVNQRSATGVRWCCGAGPSSKTNQPCSVDYDLVKINLDVCRSNVSVSSTTLPWFVCSWRWLWWKSVCLFPGFGEGAYLTILRILIILDRMWHPQLSKSLHMCHQKKLVKPVHVNIVKAWPHHSTRPE